MARTLVGGSGWLLACPRLPDVGHREGSLVKSRCGPGTSRLTAAPRYLRFSRQPPGVGPAVAGAPAGAKARAPRRRRERPRGAALKTYRKFSQARHAVTVLPCRLGIRGTRPQARDRRSGWSESG